MTKVSIAELRAPAGGYFYRLRKALTKQQVRTLFDEIKAQSQGQALACEIRVARTIDSLDYKYSFICFVQKVPVPFLQGTPLRDLRHGFVLLIEANDFLGVYRNGYSAMDQWLDKVTIPLGVTELSRLYCNEARYSKLSFKRMTLSRHELLGGSYEANDLQTAMPVAGAPRSIPRQTRLARPTGEDVSITLTTARIHKAGSRVEVDQLAKMVTEVGEQIKAAHPKGFLDSFAVPIELEDLPVGVEPTGLHFDLGEFEHGSEGESAQFLMQRPGKEDHEVTGPVLARLGAVFELKPITPDQWSVHSPAGFERAILKRNRKSFSFSSMLKNHLIYRKPGGEEFSLFDWLRRYGRLQICFSNPEYFYANKSLYRRAGFEEQVEQVAAILQPQASLNAVNSEKGQSYHRKTKSFDSDSIFSVVENELCDQDDHLWCCDLGDEWADYISLSAQGVIRFLHCKHGDLTSGASAFHEVTGQALKNLGRAQMTKDVLLEKANQVAANPYWGSTSIPKYRGNGTLVVDLEQCLKNPDGIREVILVVTMLSKIQFQSETARHPLKPYFIQLIWLLSSFMSCCRENGARPVIYCRD